MDNTLDLRRQERRDRIASEVRALMGRGIAGRRVTQRQLAAVLGMSGSSLSERLNSLNVAFDTDELDTIAEFFGVPVSRLMGDALEVQNLKKMRARGDRTRPGHARPNGAHRPLPEAA